MTPERDLINDVLSYVPDSRADDVVHFDASDDTSPLVGFNPFALHDKSLLTQRAGELELILIRTLGDMGVKMKPILSNSIYALLATQGSLHDIPSLSTLITLVIDVALRQNWMSAHVSFLKSTTPRRITKKFMNRLLIALTRYCAHRYLYSSIIERILILFRRWASIFSMHG